MKNSQKEGENVSKVRKLGCEYAYETQSQWKMNLDESWDPTQASMVDWNCKVSGSDSNKCPVLLALTCPPFTLIF